MLVFRNKRLENIRKIKQIKNLSLRLQVINTARERKNKSLLQNISDSESVFDENSSVYDDINSVNVDFGYLNEYDADNEVLQPIKEEEELIVKEPIVEELIIEEPIVEKSIVEEPISYKYISKGIMQPSFDFVRYPIKLPTSNPIINQIVNPILNQIVNPPINPIIKNLINSTIITSVSKPVSKLAIETTPSKPDVSEHTPSKPADTKPDSNPESEEVVSPFKLYLRSLYNK